MSLPRPHNAIRFWALLAVAVTSGAMIYFGNRLINLLSEPTWCNRAMGAADRADARPEYAVGGCFQLLRRQVDALALNSHFALGTLALCLLVLVVIVLAGGKLSWEAGRDGVKGQISRDAAEAADEVADAAVDRADEIKEAALPDAAALAERLKRENRQTVPGEYGPSDA